MIDQDFERIRSKGRREYNLGKLWRSSPENITQIVTAPQKIKYTKRLVITKMKTLESVGQLQVHGQTIQLLIFIPGLAEVLKFNIDEMNDLCLQANNSQSPLLYQIQNNCFRVRYNFLDLELQSDKFMRRINDTSDSLKNLIREYLKQKKVSKDYQIHYLKYLIEQRRRDRKDSSKCDLMEEKLELGDNAFLLGTTNLRKIRGRKQFYDYELKSMMNKKFTVLCQNIEKQRKKNQNNQTILRSITFLNIDFQATKVIDEGGMGNVRKISCSFVIKGSVHDAVNQRIETEKTWMQENQILSDLIEKTRGEGQNQRICFSIEKRFLLTYKNFYCENIAHYFIEASQAPEEANILYSIFYSFSVQSYLQKHKSPFDLLQFFEQLCIGTHFLYMNRILHRDLKLGNLRFDKNGTLKIIDFGSAAPFFGDERNWFPEDHIFSGTEPYYQIYQSTPPPIKKIYDEKKFYRHPLFDLYSIGIILSKIQDYLPPKNHLLFDIFNYFKEKCIEQNPNDRMEPLQLLGFINIIKKSGLLSSEFREFLKQLQC